MRRMIGVFVLALSGLLATEVTAQSSQPQEPPTGLLALIQADTSGNGWTEYVQLLTVLQNPWHSPDAQEQLRLALPLLFEKLNDQTDAWPKSPDAFLALLQARQNSIESLRLRAAEVTEQALKQHPFAANLINTLPAFASAYATKEKAELRRGWKMIRNHIIQENICTQATKDTENSLSAAIASVCPKVIHLERPEDFEKLLTDLQPILDEMNRMVDTQLYQDETLRQLGAIELALGKDRAEMRDNSKDFQSLLEAKLRRDYSEIRRSAYIAAQTLKRLNVSPEHCKLDVDWIEFSLTGECWSELLRHWQEQSAHYDVLLEQLLRHWIGRSVQSLLLSQITGCVESIYIDSNRSAEASLENLAEGQYYCHDHPTVRTLAQYLGIDDVANWARNNYPLDQAKITRIVELLGPVQPMLDWIRERHVIGKTPLGDLLLEFVTLQPEANSQRMEWTFQIAQEQSITLETTTIKRAIPIGLSAKLSSPVNNIDELLTHLSHPSGPWGSAKLSTDPVQLRVWLKLMGLPSSLVELLNQAGENAWSHGYLTLWPDSIHLALPWAASRPNTGAVCVLSWEMSKELDAVEACLKEAALVQAKAAIEPHIEQWVKSAETEFVDPLRTAFLEYLEQLNANGIFWTPEGMEIRLAGDPPIIVLLTTDGSVSFKNADTMLTNMGRRYLIRGLQSLPYIQFVFTPPDRTDAAEVYWTAHPDGQKLMGTAKRDGNFWRIKPEKNSVSLPGLNDLQIREAQINSETGNLTLDIERAKLPMDISIDEIKVTIDKQGKIAITADPEQINDVTDRVYGRLVKLGFNSLDRNAVDVTWQQLENQTRPGFIVQFTLPTSTKKHQIALNEGFTDNLRRVFEEELSEHLQGKVRRMLTEVIVKDPISIGRLTLQQHCTAETIETCQITITNRIGNQSCPLLSSPLGVPREQACADPEQLKCVSNSLKQMAAFAESIEATSLCLDSEKLALIGKASFSVKQLPPVDAAIEVDLVHGAIRPESNLEARVNEAIKLGLDKLLPENLQTNLEDDKKNIENYVGSLQASCKQFMNTLAKAPGLRIAVQINGKPGCDKDVWDKDKLRDSHKLTITFTPESNKTAPFKLEGVTISLSDGIRLQGAYLTPEDAIQKWFASMVPAAFTTGNLKVRSQLHNETLVLSTEIPLQLNGLGLETVNVPLALRINKEGMHLDQDIKGVLMNTYATSINTRAPIGIDFQGAQFFIASATVNPPQTASHILTLMSTMEVKFDEVYKIENVPIEIIFDNGQIQLGKIGLQPLCDAIKTKLNQYVQGVNLGSFIKTGKNIYFKGCDASKPDEVEVGIDLEAQILTSSSTKVGVVTINKQGLKMDFKGGATIPIAPTITLGPVSLIEPQLIVGSDPALTSIVSWPLETKTVAIDAQLRLLKQSGREGLEIGGPIKLVQFIPAGRADARFMAGTLSSGFDLGGALRNVARINGCLYIGEKDKDSCDELGYKMDQLCPETNKHDSDGASACGKGHLFQLMHGQYALEMTTKGRVNATNDVDFILFKAFGQFLTQENFSRPTLTANSHIELGKVNISAIGVEIGTTGAKFSFSFLGKRITFLIKDLHRIGRKQIEEMILRLLFPDIQLEKLLAALLSGDVTLNPFAAFGSGGGEMNADGNDGEGNAGNGQNGNGQDANAAGEAISSATAGQSDEACTELPCRDGRPIVPKHQWRNIQHDSHRSLGPLKELTNKESLKDLMPPSLRQSEQRKAAPEEPLYKQELVKKSDNQQSIPGTLCRAPCSIPFSIEITQQGEGAWLKYNSHKWWAPKEIKNGLKILNMNSPIRLLGYPIIDDLQSRGIGLPVMFDPGDNGNLSIVVLHQNLDNKDCIKFPINNETGYFFTPPITSPPNPTSITLKDWSIDRHAIDENLLFEAKSHRDALFQGIMKFATRCQEWVQLFSNQSTSEQNAEEYCQFVNSPEFVDDKTLVQKLNRGNLLVRSTSIADEDYKSCVVYLPPSVDLNDSSTLEYFQNNNWCEPTTIIDSNSDTAFLIRHTDDNQGVDTMNILRFPKRHEFKIKRYINNKSESEQRIHDDEKLIFLFLNSLENRSEGYLYSSNDLRVLLMPDHEVILYSNKDNKCVGNNRIRNIPWDEFKGLIDEYTNEPESEENHCRKNYLNCAKVIAESLVFPKDHSKKLHDELGLEVDPRYWICDGMQ